MTTSGSTIIYKEFYNKGRGLPEPKWGSEAADVQCPTCGSADMYYTGTPSDPEEIFTSEVRCSHCGRITDFWEASKQRTYHATNTPREVTGKP